MKTSVGFRKIVLSVALYVCSSVAIAHDLGVVGPVYPIAEQDMLVTIDQRLKTLEKSGELTHIEEVSKARYQAYAERPTGVALPRATRNQTFYVDPSITVPYDIKDSQGRIIYPAGTWVNPLEHINLSKQLVFFDGDDPIQVKWARSILESKSVHITPVLVNGPILALMREWKLRLYFDQDGQLLHQFGIHAVPVTVSQDGILLKIVVHSLNDPE